MLLHSFQLLLATFTFNFAHNLTVSFPLGHLQIVKTGSVYRQVVVNAFVFFTAPGVFVKMHSLNGEQIILYNAKLLAEKFFKIKE